MKKTQHMLRDFNACCLPMKRQRRQQPLATGVFFSQTQIIHSNYQGSLSFATKEVNIFHSNYYKLYIFQHTCVRYGFALEYCCGKNAQMPFMHYFM